MQKNQKASLPARQARGAMQYEKDLFFLSLDPLDRVLENARNPQVVAIPPSHACVVYSPIHEDTLSKHSRPRYRDRRLHACKLLSMIVLQPLRSLLRLASACFLMVTVHHTYSRANSRPRHQRLSTLRADNEQAYLSSYGCLYTCTRAARQLRVDTHTNLHCPFRMYY